jgi:hypothetical protein
VNALAAIEEIAAPPSDDADHLLKYGPKHGWYNRQGWTHTFRPRHGGVIIFGQDPWHPRPEDPDAWIEYVPAPRAMTAEEQHELLATGHA